MYEENLIKKVQKDIEKYSLFEKGSGIVVGLSGGADSVCLLRVLKELQNEYDLQITAVHLNHSFRGKESDEDQTYVEGLCNKWGIKLKTYKKDIKAFAEIKKISFEVAGRMARYELFYQVMEQTDAQYIATAHQKEDQAETIMLHIIRGTGLDGLCGIKIKQGALIRPLLNISRDEILLFLNKNNIMYRTDSTNLNSDYTRNRVRNDLFPSVNEMFGIDIVSQLVKLSTIVRQERDYLESLAEQAYIDVTDEDSEKIKITLSKFNDLSHAIKKRIIRIAWEKINNDRNNLEYVHVEQVLNLCQNGTTGKKIELPKGILAKISYGSMILSKTRLTDIKPYSYKVKIGGVTRAYEAGGIMRAEIMPADEAFRKYGFPEAIKEKDYIQLFNNDKIKSSIVLRNRNEGDIIRPYRSSGEKKLKKYFIDKKVIREVRDKIPLVTHENKIVWIVGMRTSNDYRARRDTQNVLILSWCDLKDGGD